MTEGRPELARRSAGGWLLLVIGIGALFSGAALLSHIIARVSLPLALAVTASMLALTAGVVWVRVEPETRRELGGLVLRGLAIGLVATLLYDASRTVLSQVDPSPYDPFEVMRAFGSALLGTAADGTSALAAGTAFHVLNGVSFGLAYVFLFGRLATSSRRWALASGVGWGLFLESFQLTLYPGWLNIEAYREFATISFLGHFVYGATLGLLAHRLLPPEPPMTEDEDG